MGKKWAVFGEYNIYTGCDDFLGYVDTDEHPGMDVIEIAKAKFAHNEVSHINGEEGIIHMDAEKARMKAWGSGYGGRVQSAPHYVETETLRSEGVQSAPRRAETKPSRGNGALRLTVITMVPVLCPVLCFVAVVIGGILKVAAR